MLKQLVLFAALLFAPLRGQASEMQPILQTTLSLTVAIAGGVGVGLVTKHSMHRIWDRQGLPDDPKMHLPQEAVRFVTSHLIAGFSGMVTGFALFHNSWHYLTLPRESS